MGMNLNKLLEYNKQNNPDQYLKGYADIIWAYRGYIRKRLSFINTSSFLTNCEEYTWMKSLNSVLGENGIQYDKNWLELHEPIKSSLGLNCYKYYCELENILKEYEYETANNVRPSLKVW